jgi:hypothetical protein
MAEEVRFTKDEQGRVVLIRGEERTVLGRTATVAEEMRRFLKEIDFGECGAG